MAGYSKDFLISAFLHRFMGNPLISIEDLCELEEIAEAFYDAEGRDKFRVYASLDADAIKKYRLETGE